MCGGREFADTEMLRSVLNNMFLLLDVRNLIHGDARGADKMAGEWAKGKYNLAVTPYPADWENTVPKRAAGPIRNQRMLDEGQPDLVIAFPGGSGTEDMCARAEQAGVPVRRAEKIYRRLNALRES